MNRSPSFALIAYVALGVLSAVSLSCGRPSDQDVNMAMGMIPVNVEAQFGTQCQYGMPSEPMPVFLGLWDCDALDSDNISIKDGFEPIYFNADCAEMYLTIRTLDGDLDTSWKIPPDGKFDVYMDADDYNKTGSVFRISSDGLGGECATYAQLNVWGEMKCKPRGDNGIDEVTLDINARWNLGKNLDKNGKAVKPTKWLELINGRECHMPNGCYLYAKAQLQQCR